MIGEAEYDLQFNEHLAQEYVDAYARMAERFHLTNDLTAARLGAQPEIFRLKQDAMDEDQVWGVLKAALDKAGIEIPFNQLDVHFDSGILPEPEQKKSEK